MHSLVDKLKWFYENARCYNKICVYLINCLYKLLISDKNFTFLQVPAESSGTHDAPHGCIHLGRFTHSRTWHWVFSNGRLDPTYPESLNSCNVLSCYYSLITKYLTHFVSWRSQLALQCLVSIRYNEDSCLRADQYSSGKIAYDKTIFVFSTLCFLLCEIRRHFRQIRRIVSGI